MIAKLAIVLALLIGISTLLWCTRTGRQPARGCIIDPSTEYINVIGDGACDWSAKPLRKTARENEPRGA